MARAASGEDTSSHRSRRDGIVPRYTDVAVLLHWAIALLILGLLAVGKYMTGLERDDGMRFVLTQWHKTFGITVLLLAVIRLAWRLGHSAPAMPPTDPAWQRAAAHVTHVLLYLLMFAIPLTGWAMASVSTLNVDTLLFDVIPWPHLPLPTGEALEHRFHTLHELAGNALILLFLLHAGAALKHHLINKDHVLVRMLPDWSSRSWWRKLAATSVAVAAFGTGVWLYADASRSAAVITAGAAEVGFVAGLSGDEVPGTFAEADVTASIDENDPASGTLEAVVLTASVSSPNPQVDGSIRDADWFDAEGFPEARFVADAIAAGTDADTLDVSGTLTIKDRPQAVTFPMALIDEEGTRVARGEFTVDRRAFDLGLESQATDDWVDYDVLIRFRFELAAPPG